MGRKLIGKSPQKPSGGSSETLLEEYSHVRRRGEETGDGMPQVLIEASPVQMTLTESKNGKFVARGEFGRVGIPTQNGRIYRKELMNREIGRLSEDISSRRVLGELDHPSDGKTSLKRVSHVITDLTVNDDGLIIGEAEILDTAEGKNLKALIAANVQIGVSSRGFGSTRPSDDPKVEGDVVQDDFVLKTWDFVADPAVKTALPEIFIEDVNEKEDAADLFLAEFPEIAGKIQEDARVKAQAEIDATAKEELRREMAEGFEQRLADAITGVRADLTESIREEFQSDPEVGGAKGVLAAISEMVSAYNSVPDEDAVRDSLRASELEVSEARQQAKDAEKAALRAQCELVIERNIGEHPMRDAFRNIIEGVEFTSVDDAERKIGIMIEEAPDLSEGYVSDAEAELREENAKLKGQISLLSEKTDTLNDKLLKAVEVGTEASDQLQAARNALEEFDGKLEAMTEERDEALAEADNAEKRSRLEAYKVQKVAGLSNGRQLMSVMEGVTSKSAIDTLVEERGVQGIPGGDLEAMRARLSRGQAMSERELNESHQAKPSASGRPQVDEFGNNMSEMQRLAGLE